MTPARAPTAGRPIGPHGLGRKEGATTITTIAITSDLHLGITDERRLRGLAEHIAAEKPQLTVLAGDVGEPFPNFAACLRIFAQLPGQVAVLAGNHDVWARGGFHSQDLWERALPQAVRDAGMLWLEESTWQRDGVAVIGTLAWYDYSAVDPTVPPYPPEYFADHKSAYNMDARFIDWPWSDRAFAARLGDAFYERLMRADGDPEVHAIVVATHVPLFDEQMQRRPHDQRWGFSNAYFGNLTLGRRTLEATKLRHVISGHTHVGRTAFVARSPLPGAQRIPVEVVPSDYERPMYCVVEIE